MIDIHKLLRTCCTAFLGQYACVRVVGVQCNHYAWMQKKQWGTQLLLGMRAGVISSLLLSTIGCRDGANSSIIARIQVSSDHTHAIVMDGRVGACTVRGLGSYIWACVQWQHVECQLDLPGAGGSMITNGSCVDVLRCLDEWDVSDAAACIEGRQWSIVRSTRHLCAYDVIRDGRRMFTVVF